MDNFLEKYFHDMDSFQRIHTGTLHPLDACRDLSAFDIFLFP